MTGKIRTPEETDLDQRLDQLDRQIADLIQQRFELAQLSTEEVEFAHSVLTDDWLNMREIMEVDNACFRWFAVDEVQLLRQ